MIIGIGVDIVQTSRIEAVLSRSSDGFVRRVLHPVELEAFEKHHQPVAFLAKRYAAKEALSKALGTGIAKGVNLKDIEVRSDELGKPLLILHGTTKAVADAMGVTDLFISLSDERDYAVANVVAQG